MALADLLTNLALDTDPSFPLTALRVSLRAPMRSSLDPTHRAAYYEAALRALRFVEQRAPTTRRFGPDADARWAALRGHLGTIDRLDLLLRDADAQWPASFGARNVFALRAVADDDAFGSAWEPLEPEAGETLWRTVLAEPAPTNLRETFGTCVSSWGLSLRPFDVGAIGPADKLLLAGPSVVAAAAVVFAARPDLSFCDQAIIVATPPAHRQIAALSGALLNVARAPAIYAALPDGSPIPDLHGRRVLVSDDADPADAAFTRRFAVG